MTTAINSLAANIVLVANAAQANVRMPAYFMPNLAGPAATLPGSITTFVPTWPRGWTAVQGSRPPDTNMPMSNFANCTTWPAALPKPRNSYSSPMPYSWHMRRSADPDGRFDHTVAPE